MCSEVIPVRAKGTICGAENNQRWPNTGKYLKTLYYLSGMEAPR